MRGFERLAALVALGLVLAGNANTSEVQTGRAIYHHGIGQDPITVEMFGQRVNNPRTFSCAACHGEFGSGGSEGGIVAPSLIVDENLSDDAVEAWLGRGLEGQVRRLAHASPQRMPHYTMSSGDRSALAGYIRTLPNPPIPGLATDRLVIGVETTGLVLDDTGRAALIREMNDLFAKVAGYGLFGRQIVVVDTTGLTEDANVFAVIMWDARASVQAPLRLSVRPPISETATDLCASVQPPLPEQYQMLTNHLDRAGKRYRTTWNGAEPPFKVSASARPVNGPDANYDVEIHLGGTLGAPADRPVYFFGDLLGEHASDPLETNVHLVLPTRIEDQELAAADVQRRFPVDARTAGAIAMMKNAGRALFTVLARSGRRILTKEACSSLLTATRQLYHIDDLNDGMISKIGS